MRVVVVGGSIAGLIGALSFARRGADVTIVEADGGAIPEALPDPLWLRRGLPHGAQAHAFHGGFLRVMRERFPDVLDAIATSGAIVRPVTELAPEAVRPHLDEQDAEITTANSRRGTIEWILRRAALEQRGVAWRDARVRALRARALDGVPHVTGVWTDDGEIDADVVLDATGRRTLVDKWLRALGSRPPSFVRHPCETIYLGRYHRLRSGVTLPRLTERFVSAVAFPWCVVLMFPGDNGILQMAAGCLPEDEVLRSARDPEVFARLLSIAPPIAEWAEISDPVTDVTVYGGLYNHLRRLVVDGEPVVTGLHLVGDAACITNPQYGRGVSHAAVHAAAVADVVLGDVDAPIAHALAIDAEVSRMLQPSYESAVRTDTLRTAMQRAALEDREPPPLEGDDVLRMRVFAAAEQDPVVWRAVTRTGAVLDPPGTALDDPEVRARLEAFTPPAGDGPPALSRAQVTEALRR